MKYILAGMFFFFATLSLMAQSNSLHAIRSLIDKQAYDQAIEKLLQINGSTPSGESYQLLAKAYSDYGWAKQLNGQDGTLLLAQALKTGSEAVGKFPHSALAHFAVGYAHHYNQQYVQAQVSYESAVRLDSTYAQAYFLLWSISSIPTQLKVESPLIHKALELDPEMADAWQKLGDFYRELGDSDQAIKHYLKALSISPHYVLNYSLGNAHLQTGNLDSARFHFEQVILQQPDFGWGHFGMASVYLMSENTAKAAIELNLSIDLNPGAYDYYLQLLQDFPKSRYDLAKLL